MIPSPPHCLSKLTHDGDAEEKAEEDETEVPEANTAVVVVEVMVAQLVEKLSSKSNEEAHALSNELAYAEDAAELRDEEFMKAPAQQPPTGSATPMTVDGVLPELQPTTRREPSRCVAPSKMSPPTEPSGSALAESKEESEEEKNDAAEPGGNGV